MLETGCRPTASKAHLRIETLDFSDIPGQSKLFVQYQTDPLSLRKFYPSAVSSYADVANRATEILDHYQTDRETLCDILVDQNTGFGASPETFDGLARLRKPGTVAVLTGQQAGLFTGPLYTIYKALSAIRMAEVLMQNGVDAVPVFWAATEDHDFDEISNAFLPLNGSELSEFKIRLDGDPGGRPVGGIQIPTSFDSVLEDGQIAAASDLRKLWKSGETIGQAFCRHIQAIFKHRGLIVVDPLDVRLKQLAAPMYAKAVEFADEIVPALVERSKELVREGYHAQVLVNEDYFPLFYHTDDGARRAVRKHPESGYRVADTKLSFTKEDLHKAATASPERFSPGVMLRPVVQDFLFPTVCYFGGGAEIAYFAQNSEVYRILDRPVTTILHRQSLTIVEAKHERTLQKYELKFTDLFGGRDELLPRIVDRFVNPTTARLFADAEENINLQLHHLDEELERIDPTLAANLATRRRKILYHIGVLQKKFRRVQIERDGIVHRQIESMFNSLMPHGGLQERTLNIEAFTSRYGEYFIDWVYDSLDLGNRGHCLLYLS